MKTLFPLLLAALSLSLSAAWVRDVPAEVDVLVVGGTAKGVVAATTAKQAGAGSVYLVTPYTYLGEDLAGTLELALPNGAQPTHPLVKKLYASTAGLAEYDYWPSKRTPHPRYVFRNDWWDRLAEPGIPSSPTDGVYYESDISYRCVLRKPAKISRVEVVVFEKAGKKKPMTRHGGKAATSAVTCKVKSGAKAGQTLALTRKGKIFDVKGDGSYPDVDGVAWEAVIDGELNEVELDVTQAEDANHQFVARIWFHLANPESFSAPPSPLKAKRILDAELTSAGVGFMTGTAVAGVKGTAVTVVNKSGWRTIRAKQVIDATRYGVLNRLQGLPVAAEESFSRLVIADGAAPEAEGMTVELLPGEFPVSHLAQPVLGRMYRCTMKLPMKDGTYPSFAAAEWEARERTWVTGMMDDADLLVWNTASWKDLETRLAEGEKQGRAAATAAKGATAPLAAAKAESAPDLPLWGEYDVVVVGGGTSGAPSAIGAARAGAKVLLVEYLNVLGGVGTDGMILGYYAGNHCGFTDEFKKFNRATGARFALYPRAETWRQMCREAGVTVWLGAMGVDAVAKNGKMVSVDIATELGCGRVRAKCFIDGTGNSDVAAAAGAETVFNPAREFALQSAGQAPHRMGRGCINSDFGYVDDTSAFDLWLFGVRARAGAPNAWDLAKMPDSRERRRIVADYMINAQDVTANRPYPDVVCQAQSSQDSHGYLIDDYRFLSTPSAIPVNKKIEFHQEYKVNIPLRTLLPRNLTGLAVVGLGMGCARDVLPMVRMQADLMNQGYAVGMAAAWAAAKQNGDFRKLDFAVLRKALVAQKILRPETLDWNADVDYSSDAVLAAAVKSMGPDMKGSDVVYRPENRARAVPLLKAAYAAATTDAERQNYAKMLGFMGDPTGAETLKAIVGGKQKIVRMPHVGAYGSGVNSMDGYMIALGRGKAPCAVEPLLAALAQVDMKDPKLRQVRGITLALEALGSPAAAGALAEHLTAVGGHAVDDPAKLPPMGGYGLGPVMDRCIRELAFARALLACGDKDGLGRRTYEAYAKDPRGVLAAHAKAILAKYPGS